MKINIETATPQINVEKNIPNRASKAPSTSLGLIDISSQWDDHAYAGQGKTIEDVMLEAGSEDIVARRNYMAVMSNTMSKEDFAKLMRDGTHPGNTEVETVVTIIDHIKAALVKGGKEIHGYTDNLDAEKFAAITGNKLLANKLAHSFKEKGLPVTEENLEIVANAWEKAKEIESLTEGAVKYMVENQLPPTLNNLYLARYSGGNDAGKQGRGYFPIQQSYLAKKADHLDWQKLDPQIEKVIHDSGYEVNKENMQAGRWLIEKGIPLTTPNFSTLKQAQEFTVGRGLAPAETPIFIEAKTDQIVATITKAIADGKNPLNTNLLDPDSDVEKALKYTEDIKQINPSAIEKVVTNEQVLNLKNLLTAQRRITAGSYNTRENDRPSQSTPNEQHLPLTDKILAAQRLLLETSLVMTAEANLRMLRTGFNIETAPLEQLVSEFKALENSPRSLHYNETITKIAEITVMPAALVARMTRFAPAHLLPKTGTLATLNEIHENGTILKASYEKAGELYEQVMTSPRRDMGDSIIKAFRNVDDILSEMNLELSQANRRAIRILGYNSMEINNENIEAVKEKDAQLQDILAKMKPGTVLEMIRQGINPLTMGLDELQAILNGKNETIAETLDSYSHFLAKLDRKGSITEAERKVYIGIYRLLRQIEKGESRVVGSLINAEMDFSLGNLLTAIRSNNRKGVDYQVNDDFGGVTAVNNDKLEASLEKLLTTQNESELREKLADILEQLDLHEINEDYLTEQLKNIQLAKGVENEIIQSLLDSNQPVTVNNLLAASVLFKKPKELYQKAETYAKENDLESILADAKERVISDFTDEESATGAFENLRKVMNDIFTRSAVSDEVSALDVRELGNLCRQINLQAAMNNVRRTGFNEEAYDIPVEIDGEITAINLLLRHDSLVSGKVSLTMDTTVFGNMTAEFMVNNGSIAGFVAVNDSEGLKKMAEKADILYTALSDMSNFEVGAIHFIKSNTPNNDKPSHGDALIRPAEKGTSTDEQNKSMEAEKVSNKELYLAAKAFITFIQRVNKVS